MLAVATTLVMCALAACGATRPARAVPDLVGRINAICTSYAEHVEALVAPSFAPASATAADLPAAARYLDRAIPLLQSEQSSIVAAGTPNSDRGLYDALVAALAAHVRDERAAQAAARVGDLHSFQAALRADQADSTRLSGTAQQFGVTSCLGG